MNPITWNYPPPPVINTHHFRIISTHFFRWPGIPTVPKPTHVWRWQHPVFFSSPVEGQVVEIPWFTRFSTTQVSLRLFQHTELEHTPKKPLPTGHKGDSFHSWRTGITWGCVVSFLEGGWPLGFLNQRYFQRPQSHLGPKTSPTSPDGPRWPIRKEGSRREAGEF